VTTAPAYTFIGVDPGPTPGIVSIVTGPYGVDDVRVVQCSASALWTVLTALDPNRIAQLQVERFVTRGRATAEQSLTRDQVGGLEQLYHPTRPILQRSAAAVKPWATDERLEAAGLLAATKGMRHAKDAARHALFAAVRDGGVPDPLSRKARA